MKNNLDALIHFQALESEVARLSQSLAKIPETIEALDALFLDLRQKLSGQSEQVDRLQKTYRSQEREADAILAGVKKSREKMDGVKTNKEYQSLLLEIEEQEAKQSKLEDQMLAGLDAIDSEQRVLQELKDEMTQLEKTVAQRKVAVQREADEIAQRLESLKGERDEQQECVDAKMLDIYNRVKSQVGPIALAPVTNAVCKVCHLTIPPQMFNELQRGDTLKFCPHCHRIIYWLAEET